MATDCEVQEDGSLVAVGERDWQMTLFDAASIRLLGQVADEDTTWDVYEITHRHGSTRTYALEVGAEPASGPDRERVERHDRRGTIQSADHRLLRGRC